MRLAEHDMLPLNFRVRLKHSWAKTPIEPEDFVRVIGTFSEENKNVLEFDDVDSSPPLKGSYLVLNPLFLISTTLIVSSFPCSRKALFHELFKNISGDVTYPLVLGNIVHLVFQKLLSNPNITGVQLRELYEEAIRD